MAQMNAAPQIPLPQREVACQTLLGSGHAVHHGNLRRRNMVNRHLEMLASIHLLKWPRNYVVLMGGCLYFYKCETDSKPCRATSLYGFTSVSMCHEEVSHEIPWPFKLVNALDDRDRTYYFSAASQKEMQEWLDAINQQIAVANRLCFPPFQQPGTPMPQAYPTQESGFPPPQQMGYPVLPQPGFPNKPRANSDSDTTQPNARTLPARPLPVPTIETEYVSDLSSDDDPDYDLPDDMAKTPDKPTPARFQKTNTLPARPVTVNQTQPTEVRRIPKVPTDNSAPVELISKQVPVKIPTPFTQNSQGTENKAPPKPFKPGGKTVAEIQPTIARKPEIPKKNEKTVPSRPEDSQVCSVYETVSGMPDVRKLVLDEPEVSSAYWKGESDEGESVMKTLQTNGIYMLRDSKESTEWLPMLTLMVRVDNMVRKYKIINSAGKFSLESTGPHFESTGQLLHHYKSNFLPHRNTKLTKPYTSVWKG